MRVEPGELSKKIAGREKTEYQMIAHTSGDWPSLFHMSDNRANVVEWIDVEQGKCALEIGAQCGAVSAVIAKKYERYVALDASREMETVFKSRKDVDGVEYVVDSAESYANYHKESFDDVYIIGGANEETIAFAYGMLKPDGRLIIATENKYGLKYWAGTAEDATDEWYAGIEGRAEVFTKKSLTNALKEVGVKEVDWYYPYPDLYFATTIYSDDYLPKQGELIQNVTNYHSERIVAFKEEKAYDAIIKEGDYPFFANSFLVIAYKETRPEEKPVYIKYSKERANDFAIRTEIHLNANTNEKGVTKHAIYPEGEAHVKDIKEKYDALSPLYQPHGIYLNEYELKDGQPVYKYIKGENLQDKIEHLIQTGKETEAEELFNTYVKKCFLDMETVDFRNTEEFQKVYGPIDILEGTKAYEKADVDLICSNIFIEQKEDGEPEADARWNVIDYEWAVDFPIPAKYVLYRSLFLAHHQIKKCDFLKLEHLMEKYNITAEEQCLFTKMEENFQNYVRKGTPSNMDIFYTMGRDFFTIEDLIRYKDERENLIQENARIKEENNVLKEENTRLRGGRIRRFFKR